jgi:flagella basal body P-ring formation protein FlgA
MRALFLSLLVGYTSALGAAPDAEAPWRPIAEQALGNALRSAHPDVADWSIAPLIARRQQELLQAASGVQARASQLGKRSSVQLSWEQDGRSRNTIVWFAVAGTSPGLATRIDVAARAPLTPEAVETVSVDALDPACDLVASPESLAGMRTRRTLHAGERLCVQFIEPRPAVALGEEVTVRARAGLVTITSRAIAQRDAAVGETVQVRNPSSGDLYVASVSGRGEVVVR